MVKHLLPPREVLDQYAPTVRFSLIRSYHRKLAQKQSGQEVFVIAAI